MKKQFYSTSEGCREKEEALNKKLEKSLNLFKNLFIVAILSSIRLFLKIRFSLRIDFSETVKAFPVFLYVNVSINLKQNDLNVCLCLYATRFQVKNKMVKI